MAQVSAPPAPVAVRVRRSAITLVAFSALFVALYLKALPCMFAKVTHEPCPGCGSTRAVLALLHGDLHDVLRYNPFGPAMAILMGIFGLQAFASMVKYGDFREAGEGRLGRIVKVVFFAVAALEVGLWVLRFFGLFGGPVPV